MPAQTRDYYKTSPSSLLNGREFRERLGQHRKMRGLLSRAYRQARKDKDYLKAAGIVGRGAQAGIKVGGIQSYEELRGSILRDIAQDAADTERIVGGQPSEPEAPAPRAGQEAFVADTTDEEPVVTGYEEEDPNIPSVTDPPGYMRRRSLFGSGYSRRY